MAVLLLHAMLLSFAAGQSDVEWQVVRLTSTRIEYEARMPDSEGELATARLVPAPAGRIPELELLSIDTVVVSDRGEVLKPGHPWVSLGKPARAGGVWVAPLVVARQRASPDGIVRCKGVRIALDYDAPVTRVEGRGVMGRLMGAVLDGRPVDDIVQPGFLIVVPDDFYENILPLAAWKEKKGFVVWVRKLSETGSQRDEIRNYIRTAYETWAPAPSYVVLVGAVNRIPAYTTGGTPCVTDHPYACVDGDDYLADLFVGRLPAANASELNTIVAKIVGYESGPYVEDRSWFARALMVGTSYQEGGTPAVTAIVTKRVIRERLFARGFTQIDTVYYPPTGSGRGPVDSAVNRGVLYVNGRGWGNYDGWGYPQYLTNDVYGLANGWKLPVVTSIYCGTGNYARNPCFGEAWLRAGTPTNPKGAVAFWGSSWTATSTRWNNCMDYAIYHAIFDLGILGSGPAMYAGKLAQYENFPLEEDSFDLRVYFHVYNLLGDPSLSMWTEVPRPLVVTHRLTHPVGTSHFEVWVRDNLGSPISGAVVALYKRGEVSAAAKTSGAGTAEFQIRTSDADTLFVTVTGPNLLPYLGHSIGASPGEFVGHWSHAPESAGPGADVQVSVTLKNFGTIAASGVVAKLSSADGFSTVQDSIRSYGDIGPGQEASAPPFEVRVAASCTSGQRLAFRIVASSEDSSWTSAFVLEAQGPTFQYLRYAVHDASGVLEPGETAELSVLVLNRGQGQAQAVSGSLLSLNPSAVTVLDSLGSFGTIAPGDSGSNSGDRFQVRASPGIGVGRRFSLRLRLEAGPAVQTIDFPITIGAPTSSSPLGPDRYGYYAYDDTDAGYSERPGFEWVEIDPAHGGTGTRLPVGNDRTATVNLPFSFKFYGRDYNLVSVCDNGYLAMGSTSLAEFYNWHIPSASGPDGFVAAFWDDFRPDTLNASGIYTYDDRENHRFLVEWSRCIHVHGFRPPVLAELQTFQVMLLDPQHYGTVSGDGPILVQHLDVQNDDSIYGNSHNFATVGIQSPDHNDGIEYTFANRCPDAAAHVAPGRAIKFTTNPPDTFTGIRDVVRRRASDSEFRVGPSPARNRLEVELPGRLCGRRLRILDVAGREVKELQPSGQRAAWDLTDESGRRVPAGVYHLELTANGRANKIPPRKVVILAAE